MKEVVVVGAGVAGISALQALRGRGYEGRLTLVGDEPEQPYNRPPLSKELLTGELSDDDIRLVSDGQLAELEVEPLLGHAAQTLDADRRTITTSAGDIHYDGLILATGSAPVWPTGWAVLDGVHTLRSLADAHAIRAAMTHGNPRVVVIGGGFIGCEIASAARGYGLETTIVEAGGLLGRALIPVLAEPLARLHRDHGVRLRCGIGVRRLLGSARVEQVELADGSTLPADLVIVGVGARPVTGWLAGSPLAGPDGVATGPTLRTVLPGVYAAGDIARRHPEYGPPQRVEHWTNALDQGVLAAENLLAPAEAEPYTAAPYVWSDQHGQRLQLAGDTHHGELHMLGRQDDGYLAVLIADGRRQGVVGLNRVREFGRERRKLGADSDLTPAAQ
ncbi:NAD(P)/FAD-dependent oxidoreductase [Nocardia sp. Marseille-Q1738]